MRLLAILCTLWFLIGGSWPWLVGGFLLWEFGGDASVIGSLWISNHVHRNSDHHEGR